MSALQKVPLPNILRLISNNIRQLNGNVNRLHTKNTHNKWTTLDEVVKNNCATLEDIQQTASRICRDYLTGRWKEVSPEQLIVKRISGGLSNYLYYVSLPHKTISDVDVDDVSDLNKLSEENLLDGNNKEKFSSSSIKNNDINGESSSITNTTISTTIRTKATSSSSITHNDENSNELVCRALLGVNLTNSNGSHNNNINNNHTGHHGIVQQRTINSKRKRCDSGSSAISLAQHTNEPQEVLLRIYGQSHGEDALEAMITESVVFALLSERNFGPKLHGIFPGGRIEQYIPARSLLTAELSIEMISRKIAEKMGEIHSLNIPMSKEPDWLWNCMQRWLRQLPSILITQQGQEQQQQQQPQSPQKQKQQQQHDDYIEFVNNFNFLTEIQWLKSVVDRDNYPVVFCHNDLQEGNILMRQDNIASKVNKTILNENNEINGSQMNILPCDYIEPDLIIIDFEYCAYNYRSFDLANHFLEWTFDYSNPQFPFFYHHKKHYPTKQQRHHFIKNYLKKFYDYEDDEDDDDVENDDNNDQFQQITTNDIEVIDKEIHIFSMLSHLFWSLWSVVNTTSNIEFGYWDYAITRIKEYQLLKQQFLYNNDKEAHMTAVGNDEAP